MTEQKTDCEYVAVRTKTTFLLGEKCLKRQTFHVRNSDSSWEYFVISLPKILRAEHLSTYFSYL